MMHPTQLINKVTSQAPVPTEILLRRKPRRVTITVSWQTYQQLQKRADYEGRSFSNLAAYLLEQGLS